MSWLRIAWTPFLQSTLAAARTGWKLWKLRNSRLWTAARHAVHAVIAQRELQAATKLEQQPSYCPLCGQIPDGDRRMDHARRIALEILPEQPRRSDLDFALAFYYWQSKL